MSEEQQDLTQWYVIQTKPGAEYRVQIHLINQGMEVFLPLVETLQESYGKMVTRIRPFFPNYLFVKIDLLTRYTMVKWTRGVNKILGTGHIPVPISERVVDTIKMRTGKNNLVRLEDEFKEGDIVRIISGPFKELRGVFQRKISNQGRINILLNLIGVDVPVQISKLQVKKVA